MKPAELRKKISSGACPPLICLHGEEEWQRDRLLDYIVDRLIPHDARDFNLSQYHGKQASGRDIVEQLQTLPVFAERRLVVVREADQLSAAALEALFPLLKNPVPESILLLVAGKIDKRRRFWQEFGKRGAMVEFRSLYANEIPAHIEQTLAAQGWSMTPAAMELFCRRVGTNLQEIHAELDKLRSFIGDRNSADAEDVDAVISRVAEEGVFDLAHAIGRGKTGPALELLGQLLGTGVAPVFILAMTARHFRQLWAASLALEKGLGRKQMAAELKINPYFVDGLVAQARHFSPQVFPQVLERLLEVDVRLKSGGGEPRALLERLVFDLVALRASR
ncbi:MAG: DNA polymerase III subunit delta [Deltaproteobacteria bacterium]|nr:MAG: DNA polymerase III subunit delta [Deltaproteobacteria bacterium]